jgi:hypothetical protein
MCEIHFWPKNGDEKWSGKNIFEILQSTIFMYHTKEDFYQINDIFCAWSDFKKKLGVVLHMINETFNQKFHPYSILSG